jgi:ArsR family transcriptional regulator, virulence genes transcriptional regulator
MPDRELMDEIYALEAEVLKTMANARRLEIIHRLAQDGPSEVGRLASEMGISQPNLSQHLAVMRASGVVEGDRVGRQVRYRLSDPNIVRACGLMRDVLEQRVLRLAALSGVHPPSNRALAASGCPLRGRRYG